MGKRFHTHQKKGDPDGSKTNEGTGGGKYCHGTRQRSSFHLGKYTTVIQAEVYANKACVDEDIKRGTGKGTFIFSLIVKLRSARQLKD
jgi:hypothetical protein